MQTKRFEQMRCRLKTLLNRSNLQIDFKFKYFYYLFSRCCVNDHFESWFMQKKVINRHKFGKWMKDKTRHVNTVGHIGVGFGVSFDYWKPKTRLWKLRSSWVLTNVDVMTHDRLSSVALALVSLLRVSRETNSDAGRFHFLSGSKSDVPGLAFITSKRFYPEISYHKVSSYPSACF